MKQLFAVVMLVVAVVGCSSSGPGLPGEPTASGSVGAANAGSPDTPRNYVAHLNGDGEIPANASQGQGQVIFQLNPAGTALSYRLISSNIDNVVAAHIHVAAPGANGP